MSTKLTRDHLIDVGQKMMHRHGYNATGLSDILKVADVPKGSFYHHLAARRGSPWLPWSDTPRKSPSI
jgi:TetR/AcrR family transcriptional regulator, transcriptional repressor for nem operon